MIRLLLRLRTQLDELLHPFRRLDRWLLSRWPMIRAERYHVALTYAVVFSAAAALLGVAHGVGVSYSPEKRVALPVEMCLWLTPWCVAAAWFWGRAKGYESLPISRITHGLHYGIYDLMLVFLIVGIPTHYGWAFRAGLATHVVALEQTAADEYRLKSAWNEWHALATSQFTINELNANLVHWLPSGTKAVFIFGMPDWSDFDGKPSVADWSAAANSVHPNQYALMGNADRSENNAATNNEAAPAVRRNELLAEIGPLSERYMGVDITPDLAAIRDFGDVSQVAAALAKVEPKIRQTDQAFDEFRTQLGRYLDFEFTDDRAWTIFVIFTILLSALAIPATTVRLFLAAWALLMTGAVLTLYFVAIFDDLLSDFGPTVAIYAVVVSAAVTLLIALTSRNIKKHGWIKMISVFAPAGLIYLMSIVISKTLSSQESETAVTVGVLLVAVIVSAICRLMFNRLRSLPEPY